MRARHGFTFVEVMVAGGVLMLLLVTLLGASSTATRQAAVASSLADATQAAVVARSVLAADLDALVVSPGRHAARATSNALRFRVVGPPGGGNLEELPRRSVHYEARPAAGGFQLWRDGRLVVPAVFRTVAFTSATTGSRHLVTARLELELKAGGTRAAGRTVILEVARAYGIAETYPGLKSYLPRG